MKKPDVAVVMINWNGEEDSLACIAALKAQSQPHTIIVVDNNSSDSFVDKMHSETEVIVLENGSNLGFAGGVNTGIRYAINHQYTFVALINNDAKPEPQWLQELVSHMGKNDSVGVTTSKLLRTNGDIDSTGDQYTSWGLAFPRGRDTQDDHQFDKEQEVFGASGGASLYRSAMLQDIGLFDEDFFAYYEDVDVSFRAQLAGWKIMYVPTAIAHHKVGASSAKIPNLTTYMTIKNLPWLFWKNVPLRLVPRMWPRFFVAHNAIIFSSLRRGKIWPVAKGVSVSIVLFPKKLLQRRRIQKNKTVSTDYIWSIITHDLPPNAHKLRRLRSFFTRRKS